MNYEILKDREKFYEFLDWLPEPGENEKYYCCLFARKKYAAEVPWIKSDKSQLKRFLSDKKRLENKIRQLHCEVGSFMAGDVSVPQKSLALYISPNPRDMEKATWNLFRKSLDILESKAKGFNIHAEALSQVQKSATKNRKYIGFDLDWKDESRLTECIDIADGFCDVIETRGGYHLFVLSEFTQQISDKLWYKKLAAESDNTGDMMTPVVGCVQGDFVPFFKYRYHE